MIRPIMKIPLFLERPSEAALPQDVEVARDLVDTLAAHADECAGMAANMIGVRKRIIVFDNEGTPCVMFNPVIVKSVGPYETQERCLSLAGTRGATRYKRITVEYDHLSLDAGDGLGFVRKKESFQGWTAQIIQHEVDHCEGVLI